MTTTGGRWFIEEHELTIAHLGLDDLGEHALMRLFGDAHSHRITRGTGNSIAGIVDQKGRPLYPANYFTHLHVPPGALLHRYRLWERVAVAVDVSMLGWMLLDTRYVLGRPGAITESSDDAQLEGLPWMRGCVTLMVDGQKTPEVVPPRSGVMAADLRRITRTPETMEAHRRVRADRSVDTAFSAAFRARSPIVYPVVAGRDAAVGYGKHTWMQFATFLQIMDVAEREVLLEHVAPAFPSELVDSLAVLERETYYFRNCVAGDVLRVQVRGRFDAAPDEMRDRFGVPAILTCIMEIEDSATGDLLVAARVRKVPAIPAEEADAIRRARDLAEAHGGGAAAASAERP